LDRAVIVAVIAVRVMQVPVNQEVDVVAMRNGLVSAAGAVFVAAFDLRRATGRIRPANRDHMFVDVVAMRVMQMAVMQVIDMTLVPDGGMAAIGAMLVGVVGVMLLFAGSHD
jgi:hypothetical protein